MTGIRNRMLRFAIVCAGMLMVTPPVVRAQGSQIPQGYNSQDWTTVNADAERDSWVRTDPYISLGSMQNPTGFGVVRKVKLEENPTSGHFDSQAIFETEAGGYKSMGYVIDSAGNAVGFDSDTDQIFWRNPLASGTAMGGNCPKQVNAGMTRALTEMVPTVLPYGGIELGFRIRDRQPVAGGVVGEPHQGATNISEFSAPFGGANGPGFRAPGGGVFVLGPDGFLHQLSLLKGFDVLMAPAKFLPPNASTAGLTAFDKYVYVATSNSCGDVPNGVWGFSLADSSVVSWNAKGASIAGTVGAAFGTDGSLYVATGEGPEGSAADSVVSMEQKTLRVRSYFSPGKTPFVATPVVLTYPNWNPARGKDMVVAANKDGKLYLMDSVSLGGADRKTALTSSTKYTNYSTDYVPGALASWQDAGGNRWVLAPIGSAVASDTHFPINNGSVTDGAIVAFKVIEQGGKLKLEPGWVSRNMVSPLPPAIVNGVVFALSSGEYHTSDASMTTVQRAQRSVPAVLYALDAMTGKELWNSGTALPSYAHSVGLSLSFSTIYVTTADDTLWSFGSLQDQDKE